MRMDRSYFFDNGIRFECTRCGHCCTGEPGHVWVNDEEINRLAKHLGLSRRSFLLRHTRRVRKRRSLKEYSDGRCIFYEDERCTVYSARPTQCRTYPFWLENLRSKQAWKETKKECPGIGKGRRHSKDEIIRKIHGPIRDG